MAKKRELTIEEKLEQALVAKEDEPYQIPQNWCWVKGKYLFKNMETKKPTGEEFLYIDIDSIDNKNQCVTEPKKLKVINAPSRANRKLHDGDTIFSMVRPYLRNIAYINKTLENCIASTGFFVCSPKKNLMPIYLYYLMISEYVVAELTKQMKGDNSPSIRKGDIENFLYPIAPLKEQQRIVAKIENLFSKLNKAKDFLQAIIDKFEQNKMAVLQKAFTGELTANWRAENNLDLSSWQKKSIADLCTSLKYGSSKKSQSEGAIPVIRMGNLQNGEIDWNNLVYTDDKDEIKKYMLTKGEVLFTRTNGSANLVGKTAIYRGEQPAIYAGYLIKLDYTKELIGEYLN